MKKPVIVILLFLCVLPIFSADVWVILENGGGVTGNVKDSKSLDTIFNTSISPWGRFILNKEKNMSLSFQGTFKGGFSSKSKVFDMTLDLNNLRFSTDILNTSSGKLSVDLGRYLVTDVSSFVFNQPLDGASLYYTLPIGSLSFAAGYTGLLNAYTTPMAVTPADSALMSGKKNTDLYKMAAPKVVTQVALNFPELFLRSDLNLEVIAQFDMTDVVNKTTDLAVNTQYTTVGFSGPFANVPQLYYSAAAVLETGYFKENSESKMLLSPLVNIRLDYFLTKNNLRFFTQHVYSPYVKDTIAEFSPISAKSAGVTYSGSYANLYKGALGAGWKPFSFLSADFATNLFIQPHKMDASDAGYKMTEFVLGVSGRVKNSIGIRLDGAVGVPKDGNLFYDVRLKASIEL